MTDEKYEEIIRVFMNKGCIRGVPAIAKWLGCPVSTFYKRFYKPMMRAGAVFKWSDRRCDPLLSHPYLLLWWLSENHTQVLNKMIRDGKFPPDPN